MSTNSNPDHINRIAFGRGRPWSDALLIQDFR
jgi:hypothetical protein